MQEPATAHDLPTPFYTGHIAPQTGWSIEPHQHDHHQLIMVLQGQIEANITDLVLRGEAGSVLFYPQGIPHQERSIGRGVLETLYVGFRTAAHGIHLGARPTISFDQTGRIRMLMQWMHELTSSPQKDRELTQAALLQAVLEEAVRHPEYTVSSEQIVRTAVRYMREKLAEPLCLADIAKIVNVSAFHFSRIFRRHTGQTPMRFLAKCRVEAAHSLLQSSTLPMKAIARRTGLSDPFHFSRTFRRLVGYPPSRVRRPELSLEAVSTRRHQPRPGAGNRSPMRRLSRRAGKR